MNKRNFIIVGLIAAAALIAGLQSSFWAGDEQVAAAAGDPLVNVTVPNTLSSSAEAGQSLFNANCATCHGVNAAGHDGVAPPLVHIIYEPNHHGDESFQLAVSRGVRAHHWPFGNMPAVEGLDRQDVSQIITYVRELQLANGIR